MLPKVYISSKGEFVDEKNNLLPLRGVNLDPSVKFPSTPNQPSHAPVDYSESRSESVSFINHPLPVNEVKPHILRLKSLGFNCLRIPFTWESMEHDGPGKYDFEYMDYLIDVLKEIHNVDNGMYIYLDPHQDVWSRFTGGSGAPLWTLYAAGFQPTRLKDTDAAVIHNDYSSKDNLNEDGEKYLKMLWTTNYYRLACQTMFTLFFGGKIFAPKCIINGVNIQEYLQTKFIDTVLTFYSRCLEKAPILFEDNCIIGLESMNEPNNGFIGMEHLNEISSERKLKLGTTPTALQSFLLGEGVDCTVQYYDLKLLGPMKQGTRTIKSNKLKCWLTKEERNVADDTFGWKRGEEWLPHQCVWRLHDVWKFDFSNNVQLLRPNYFHINPVDNSLINERTFINEYFMEYYAKFYKKFRAIDQQRFILLQPPVLREPPNIVGTELEKYVDKNTIFACHFYDGFSLMYKTWNEYFNVDTLGIMRGKSPIFSLKFGETSIRKSIRKQLREMKQEVRSHVGKHVGLIFSEIGMPFDMNNKKSYYEENPKLYASQLKAMDAIMYALEGSNLSFSLWCYCHRNSHKWGDDWNNEDFSIWSPDDLDVNAKAQSLIKYQGISNSLMKVSDEENAIIKDMGYVCDSTGEINYDGIRALSSLLRPFPMRLGGRFVKSEFNGGRYFLALKGPISKKEEQAEATSYIFLPQYHFPLENIDINKSSGSFTYYSRYQVLQWDHNPVGLQYIKITKKTSDAEGVASINIDDNSNKCIIT
ncbi:ergosteryl-beta-glucosidase [Monosporozyma servazzii]